MKLKTVEADTQEFGEWENVPENTLLNAKFMGMEPHSFDYVDSDTGQTETAHKLNWNFEVTEQGKFNARKLRGQTPTTFSTHENCKAMNWMISISGRSFAPDEDVESEDYIGFACRVITSQSKPDSQGRIWDNVVDVLPSPSSQSAGNVFG